MLKSKGNYIGMVLLDLQKAFDTVDHEILCDKLEAMGINFTKWFKSYLGDRKQIVVANGTSSESEIVSCGVLQGSMLGPLIFLCYVNDMSMSVKYKLGQETRIIPGYMTISKLGSLSSLKGRNPLHLTIKQSNAAFAI